MRPAILKILFSGLALAAVDASVQVQDVNGARFRPFATDGKAAVIFFLSTECPISRLYATEIQRICASYRSRGVRCSLIFEDLPLAPASVRRHLIEFSYRNIPAAIDETGTVAKQAGASVTPQAVIVDGSRRIRYRGRIDNFYADLGKSRRQATVHDLTDALDAILAGRVVSNPETKPVGCFITFPEGGRK
jgi:hypothetical protein